MLEALAFKPMAVNFVHNVLQTVQCPLAVDLTPRHPSIPPHNSLHVCSPRPDNVERVAANQPKFAHMR